jgi:hypothetical protein
VRFYYENSITCELFFFFFGPTGFGLACFPGFFSSGAPPSADQMESSWQKITSVCHPLQNTAWPPNVRASVQNRKTMKPLLALIPSCNELEYQLGYVFRENVGLLQTKSLEYKLLCIILLVLE